MHSDNEIHRYFSEDSRPFPPLAKTYVMGPCTGGFAAAAVSCSQTLLALVENGVQAVLAAFRTALRSFIVGQSLSPRLQSTQPNNSWSAAIKAQGDNNVEQMLDNYASAKVRVSWQQFLSLEKPNNRLDTTSRINALDQCCHTQQNNNTKRPPFRLARFYNNKYYQTKDSLFLRNWLTVSCSSPLRCCRC